VLNELSDNWPIRDKSLFSIRQLRKEKWRDWAGCFCHSFVTLVICGGEARRRWSRRSD